MANLEEYQLRCPSCGHIFDTRYISQVAGHMHGAVQSGKIEQCPPGKGRQLEHYLEALNPGPAKDLIYDFEYHIWRNGQYKGVATWTKDSSIGDSFQTLEVNSAGRISRLVWPADLWIMKVDE